MPEQIEDKEKKPKKITREQYRKYWIQASVVILASFIIIIFYFCVKRYAGIGAAFSKLNSILSPIIIGFVLAFLMNPIMRALEKGMLPFFLARSKDEKKTRHRVRNACSIISLLIFLGIIAVFLWAVVPQLVDTVNDLINNIDSQIIGVIDWADNLTKGYFAEQLKAARDTKNIENALHKLLDYIKNYLNLGASDNIVKTLTNLGISVGKGILNAFLGIIVSVYVLNSKEVFKSHTKKIVYGIFKTSHANEVLDVGRKAKEVFYGFISGKIIDSIIIGVLCYFLMLLFRFPYPMLCSFIIGVTNVIPVFGPYIGGLFTVPLVFMNNPVMGIYFLIFVIVLQQVDGNIIGPAILGNSTGLSPFWVVFAIVIGGGLFGVIGMLLGVPTVALLYYIGGKIANWAVKKRGHTTQSSEYVDLKAIDPKTNEMIIKTEEEKRYSNPFKKSRIISKIQKLIKKKETK